VLCISLTLFSFLLFSINSFSPLLHAVFMTFCGLHFLLYVSVVSTYYVVNSSTASDLQFSSAYCVTFYCMLCIQQCRIQFNQLRPSISGKLAMNIDLYSNVR